ncbi:MAG: hypothetical protein U0Q16_28380 [Bryobacteraceae bacterium]
MNIESMDPGPATGPRTEAGKARSSQNAVKHGLTSRAVVLAHEDPAAWLAHLQDYIDRFQPADNVEMQLVEQLAATQWRMRRAWALETAAIDHEMLSSAEPVESIDDPTRAALAHRKLTDTSRSLAALERHEARLTREFHRVLTELRQLQSTRIPPPAGNPLEKS